MQKCNQLLCGHLWVPCVSYPESGYPGLLYVRIFVPLCRLLFHSSEDAKESEAKLKGQWETSGVFTPLPASGYTCIATGDSPRSSIINVHRVSQVEAPKSIYPTAFRVRVKCIVRSAIVCVHSYARSRVYAYTPIKYGQYNRVGTAERRNFTSIKTDSASRNEDRSILEFRQVVD